jgi:hypothetical protein
MEHEKTHLPTDDTHRRHLPTIVAVVAAAALVAGLVFWSVTTSPDGVTPAGPTASPTTTTVTPTTSTWTQTTTVAPPTTGTPQLDEAYAAGDRLRIGDRTIQLPPGTTVIDFAVLDGGGVMIASSTDAGRTSAYAILGPDGRTLADIDAPATDRPGRLARWAASPDGRRVLVSTGERAIVYSAAGAVVSERAETRQAAAIVGNRAYLRPDDPTSTESSTEWDVAAGTTRALPNGVRAVSRDGRLAAINWHPPELGDGYASCWAIIDLEGRFQKALERCGGSFLPDAFSATGTYVIGENYLDGGDVDNLAVARADDGSFAVGGADRPDWFLGWSIRMSEDEQSILVARNTSPATADRPLEVTLVRCSLDLQCATLEPELRFEWLARPPYVVGR